MNRNEHILTTLSEECLEVAKDISKSLRFGLEDRNILNPSGPTNLERMVDELNDLKAMIAMAVEAGIIPEDWESEEKQDTKRHKVERFMKYAEEVGALDSRQAVESDRLVRKADIAREGNRVAIAWQEDDPLGEEDEYSDTIAEALSKSVDDYRLREIRRKQVSASKQKPDTKE